jgi:glucosamine--fructose-6-phosphate aminotransferase (isomerizing)
MALKLKELTYILAHPYSSAEFMHGPIAVAGKGFPVVLIAHSGAVTAEIPDLIDRLNVAGVELMIISDIADLCRRGKSFVRTPECPEWLSPLTAVIPGQLLALKLSEKMGHDPDDPRGLEKVTRTT